MIDFHSHFGNLRRESYPRTLSLTIQQWLDRMDREGIDAAVLLPLESPEGGWGYLLTEDVVRARDMYPERFIAFVAVDPRYPHAARFIDYFVNHHGCMGFGEHVNGLVFDDPQNMAIYAKRDEYGLPLVFEINKTDLCHDDVGLPRLGKCLCALSLRGLTPSLKLRRTSPPATCTGTACCAPTSELHSLLAHGRQVRLIWA